MPGMISLGSLSAFSAGGATSALGRAQASGATAAASGVNRVRAQSANPATPNQALPKTLPSAPGKPLPRGSLLNLQV